MTPPHLSVFAAAALLLAATVPITAATPLAAQQIGSNTDTTKPATYTLTVQSQLVVETVVVKDKAGHFVEGLTAKDFLVTEDGVPQTIRSFERQQLPTGVAPLPVTPSEDERITLFKHLSRTTLAPESGTARRYTNRRLLAFYFDMTAMRPEDQQRALAAAETFVRTQMTASDVVSILRYSGGAVDVLEDFTADRNRLLSILETMVVGEGQEFAEGISDSSATDTGAAFGQDSSEFNIFNTDRQLAALQTAAHMLSQLNEKKALLYFADGLRLNGNDNQAQLRATVDSAIRAGVSFWPIDARGLVADAPLGDATQGSPGNAGLYNGTAAQATADRFQQSQDTLYSLAADTGGKALLDNNDLSRGILDAQRSIADYYILAYYSTDTAENGRFRKVSISLAPTQPAAAGATLDYRRGYFARKEFARFNSTDKERQLEDALMLGDPITDLTIALEINYFQLNRAEYYVPLMVKIPGRELALAKKFGAEHTLIDFVCEIKDLVDGSTVANVRDNVNVKLTGATAAELARRPVEYDAGFTLLPGRYSLKFLARDDETGRIGTYQTSFTIPNLEKTSPGIALSSVVLSSQRADLKDALYDAAAGKDKARNDAANPLVSNGQKLIPSVTRVFHADRTLYVYLQAYAGDRPTPAARPPASTPVASSTPTTVPPAGTSASPPLIAYVSLLRAGAVAFQTPPVAATPLPGTRLGVVPLRFDVNLGSLAPGEYQCQVSVLDPTGKRVSFWRGPFLLVR